MNTNSMTLSAWGNSHGVRLNRALMQAAGLEPGVELEAVVIAKGRLELRAKVVRPTLAEKLKRFDPVLHGSELLADSPVGVEFGSAGSPRQP